MKQVLSVTFAMMSLSLAACSNGGGGSSTPLQSPVVVTPTTTTSPTGIPTSAPVINGHFTYEMSVNGCSTGKKEFATLQQYCEGLLNDTLNNSCARELRSQTFARQCTGNPTVGLPGTIGSMGSMNSTTSTARCVVNGSDLKSRTFLQSLNPFNPQSRQVMRDMFWDGRSDRSFDIFGTLVADYGRAKFTMRSAQKGLAADGTIGLTQRNGVDAFLVRSNLGSQISLTVSNESEQKQTQVVCVTDRSFKRAKADLRKVRCVYQDESLRASREEVFAWDQRSEIDTEIFSQVASSGVTLRLKPAQNGSDEKVELELQDLDSDKTLRAEGTLNEGLEVRFNSRETGANIVLSCAPASK